MSGVIAGLPPIDELETLSQHQAIDIPTNLQPPANAPYNQPRPPRRPNLPRGDLLRNRKEYLRICVPLYEASITGDWEAAKVIIDKRPELVRFSITENHETTLHVAASAKRTKFVEDFVENLVNLMEEEDLQLQNKNYNTALCLAAAAGSVKMAESMVKKNRGLLNLPGSQDMMPLYMAALFGNSKMVKYLYKNSQTMSGDYWTPQNRGWVLLKCVEANLFDVALDILNDRPDILDYRDNLPNGQKGLPISSEILRVLARKPRAFKEIKPPIMRRIINSLSASFHLKVGPAEKENQALQLLRIVWKNVVEKPTAQIDDIIRGPPDSEAERPAEKESQVVQLLRFTWENVVKKHKSEIDKMIKGPLDHVSNDEAGGSGRREPEAPQLLRIIWDDIAYKREKEIDNMIKAPNNKKTHPSRILFVAAEMGNTRFLVELIRQYPDLIWKRNDHGLSIFHIAVSHRHESIYNLLYEIGSNKDLLTPLKDENGNNMLHFVGKIAKEERLQDVSGVALQMQRELLWFKEVEAMIPPSYRERKNKDGLTPHQLFTKEHKDLVTLGEKWMKGTAAQCMVVATLIATIVFAAAFTVPGGYNQNDGIPMFYQNGSFIVFVISDAISLFFSSASILMFLSILTSRYAERDFLESLPRKLMIGLFTLFFSITSMMIAFSVSFFVLYHKDLLWVPILISVSAAVPVILFGFLQYPLLVDVFRSTYGARYLFKPTKRMLYSEKQKL